MKKHFGSFFRFFLIYLFGFLVFAVMTLVTSLVYGTLSEWLPDIFKTYNFVTEKEAAELLSKRIKLCTGALSLFLMGIFPATYDNQRYEYMISQTDGFYTIREGAPIYISEYLFADLLVSATVPLTTFPLVFINITDEAPRVLRILEKYLNSFIAIPLSVTELCGYVIGAVILVAVSVAARAVGAYAGLFRWRAIWLSDIGKESA